MGQLEEDNKELARRMIAALTKADVDFIKEYYAEDFQIWVAGSLPFSGTGDKAYAVAGMPVVLGLFPKGLRFSIVAMTAEGDRVAIEAASAGTTASGREYRQTYHFLMRVRDGKIVEWKEYMDTEHAREVLVV
ncbi:MAG: nuclear transport factor 2 family protein [Deltaproteobacteria bacterium]|nr:nuclear transport factor 2 family protein [Deltaproteobacteria bacterium]